jgi:hypothetical protein
VAWGDPKFSIGSLLALKDRPAVQRQSRAVIVGESVIVFELADY